MIWTAHLALTLTPVPSDGKQADDAKAVAKALATARTQIEGVASGGGYVSSSNGGGNSWSFTLRVPNDDFSAALTELSGFGTVSNESSSSQDVSLQVADLAGRIDSANKTIDQFRLLLTKATKIGDILAIENELSTREADLESLMRQQASLSDQVSLSTISVTVTVAVKPLAGQEGGGGAPAAHRFRQGHHGRMARFQAIRQGLSDRVRGRAPLLTAGRHSGGAVVVRDFPDPTRAASAPAGAGGRVTRPAGLANFAV